MPDVYHNGFYFERLDPEYEAECDRLQYSTLCSCGSGEPRWILTDARGIPVGYVCNACVEEKKSHYRPEIFTDSNYYADEDID